MSYDEVIRLQIEDLLRQKIGLNAESVGTRSILRSVRRGMRAGKMQQLTDYLESLQSSPKTFEALIESVVVPETSFFRNRASFVFLRQWIAQEWRETSAVNRPLRVLSIPCSTGEEPYSIAITLFEEHLSKADFQIDAIDISALAIEKAKQGVYSPYAFRRQTYRSDDKYFTLGVPEGAKQTKRTVQRYYLVDKIRESVSFSQGNVLDPQLLINQPPYDLVFCRNLLIYFDKAARDRLFTLIDRVLKPGGLLFVGHAEGSMVDTGQYHPVPYPQTFAYRKHKQGHLLQSQPVLSKAAVPIDSAPFDSAPSAPVAVGATIGCNQQTAANANNLELAQQLANQGETDAAMELCTTYLKAHPTVAHGHLLCGELHQEKGNDTAAQTCFEKALYLDPKLGEALTHLLLIKESQTDVEGAAKVRDRLQRLYKESPEDDEADNN